MRLAGFVRQVGYAKCDFAYIDSAGGNCLGTVFTACRWLASSEPTDFSIILCDNPDTLGDISGQTKGYLTCTFWRHRLYLC